MDKGGKKEGKGIPRPHAGPTKLKPGSLASYGLETERAYSGFGAS